MNEVRVFEANNDRCPHCLQVNTNCNCEDEIAEFNTNLGLREKLSRFYMLNSYRILAFLIMLMFFIIIGTMFNAIIFEVADFPNVENQNVGLIVSGFILLFIAKYILDFEYRLLLQLKKLLLEFE